MSRFPRAGRTFHYAIPTALQLTDTSSRRGFTRDSEVVKLSSIAARPPPGVAARRTGRRSVRSAATPRQLCTAPANQGCTACWQGGPGRRPLETQRQPASFCAAPIIHGALPAASDTLQVVGCSRSLVSRIRRSYVYLQDPRPRRVDDASPIHQLRWWVKRRHPADTTPVAPDEPSAKRSLLTLGGQAARPWPAFRRAAQCTLR